MAARVGYALAWSACVESTVIRMDPVLVTMAVVFAGSTWIERRARRRREHAILEMQERVAETHLAVEMEDAGFNLVEIQVNERGCRLRDNAENN